MRQVSKIRLNTSCSPKQRGTLFFGGLTFQILIRNSHFSSPSGETVLKIELALQRVSDVLRKYDKFMEPINALTRMINGLTLKGQEIVSNKKSQKSLTVCARLEASIRVASDSCLWDF